MNAENKINVSNLSQIKVTWRIIVMFIVVLAILFLALYNLDRYPLTWFDEGSHLHVPKTLLTYGVYADYSSEGFRYYGPTIGVGPTVMLPIAGMLKIFGDGLFQARLVIALYLLATIFIFYRLCLSLGSTVFAFVSIIILLSSRGVLILEYGRQVLGEVPGLFFLILGILFWFAAWEKGNIWRLCLAGIFFGLAVVTKYQYLLFILPALCLTWFVNLIYYRTNRQRVYFIPVILMGVCFAIWQAYLILYLGPSKAVDNLQILAKSAGGVAFIFSPAIIQQNLELILSRQVFLGALLPALIYGLYLIFPRNKEGQKWIFLYFLILVNLGWFTFLSIGWQRYAFLGLAFASIFVCRFLFDLSNGFHFEANKLISVFRRQVVFTYKDAVSLAMIVWLIVMVILPLGNSMVEIVKPAFNAPQAMASYLDENVSKSATIETYEPEMGFLTNHNYHFPPANFLNDAIYRVWFNKPPVDQVYDFTLPLKPDYVLVGHFGRSVEAYSPQKLAESYTLVTTIGEYDLYKNNSIIFDSSYFLVNSLLVQ